MPLFELKEIKTTPNEKEVHWKVDFFSLSYDLYESRKFTFLNAFWCLQLHPFKDNVALHLQTFGNGPYNVKITLGLKKNDDTMFLRSSLKHIFCWREREIQSRKFFTRSTVQQYKSELMTSNLLTITCKLSELPTDLTGRELLSDNIKSLFVAELLCDITLHVEDKDFKAHKNILAARSSVFAAMFRHETSEKQTGIVNIPDCDSESFQDFLEYLYSGKIKVISFRSSLNMYKTADKYDVQELKIFCADYMECNLKVENICDAISFAEEYEEENLQDATQKFFNVNIQEILVTSGWKNLLKYNFNLGNKLLIKMAPYVKFLANDVQFEIH